jgi:DNA/RNA endonuclease YhcR with UshA esterase domain
LTLDKNKTGKYSYPWFSRASRLSFQLHGAKPNISKKRIQHEGGSIIHNRIYICTVAKSKYCRSAEKTAIRLENSTGTIKISYVLKGTVLPY